MRPASLIRCAAAAGLPIVCVAAPIEARAATQAVIFDGNVAAACTLVVGDNGTMAIDTAMQVLSSQNPSGDAGTVTLSTTGGVTLGVDVPVVVSQPTEDASATTWVPTFAVSGAHTVAERTTTTPLADPGTSTVTVNLAGTKSGSDRFAAGDYEVSVTVRCE